MGLDYQKDYPQGMAAVNDPNTLLVEELERKDWRRGIHTPGFGGLVGLLYPAVKNFFYGVPIRTGIYQYPLFAAIGVLCGKLFEDYRSDVLALRDAHYKQYIRNHPEDFQPAERKKVGDLLKPWMPIR